MGKEMHFRNKCCKKKRCSSSACVVSMPENESELVGCAMSQLFPVHALSLILCICTDVVY